MKKVSYYRIDYSVDKKVTGVNDAQIRNLEITEEQSGPEMMAKYQEIYYDFLEDDFDLNLFIGDARSKKTDILSSNFLDSSGLFISKKFREFLNNYAIGNYKYRKVAIKNLTPTDEYIYLNLVKCALIDYNASTFFVVNQRNEEESHAIVITSHTDYLQKINQLIADRGFSFTISENKIVLRELKDLFKYEIDGTFLISGKLKSTIEKSDLKGITIEPFDIDFYIDS